MKQLRDSIAPKLVVTYPGGGDKSDHQNWLRTSCEIHKSQLQDGTYFLHEHLPRDQNLGSELIHDLLMNEKVWYVRVDPERDEPVSIIEPGRCVFVRK